MTDFVRSVVSVQNTYRYLIIFPVLCRPIHMERQTLRTLVSDPLSLLIAIDISLPVILQIYEMKSLYFTMFTEDLLPKQ